MCLITVVAHSRLQLGMSRNFTLIQLLDVNVILFSRIPEYLLKSLWWKGAQACFLRHAGHVKSRCIQLCLVSGKFPKYSSHVGRRILKSLYLLLKLNHVWDTEQNDYDNPIELYMCLCLWSNHSSQITIWDQREDCRNGINNVRTQSKAK